MTDILMVGRFEIREQYACLANDTHETFLVFGDTQPLIDAGVTPDCSGQPVGVKGSRAGRGIMVKKMYRL